MDAGNPGSLQIAFQRQIEVGRVDADEDLRLRLQELPLQGTPNRQDFTQAAQRFNITAHRKCLHRKPGFGTQRLHLGAGNTDKLKAGLGIVERVNQQAAKQIARRFARDNTYLNRRLRQDATND